MQYVLLWSLILIRVGGLVTTAPIFGTAETPLQVRGLLAFALAMLVAPCLWSTSVPLPATMPGYVVMAVSELVVGLGLGMGIAILFSGLQLAGQMIGHASGLGAAEVFDPSQGDNVPLLSRLMFLVGLSVFLLIGGHRMVLGGLLESFQAIPPGSAAEAGALVHTLVALVAQSFELAIRAAAPVVISLVVANLVLGLIGRTLPQLNILVIGFGMNALLAVGVLTLSLGGAAWVFQDQVEPTVATILEGMRGK